MRGPNLANLTPEQQAAALFNRIMRLHEQGKTDSVQFFAQMGLQAFQMLQDRASLTLDQRYEMARIAEVAGAIPFARAHADTMLASQPTHLLALALASRLAERVKDSAALAQYERRLIAAERSELAKGLEEYQAHKGDIDSALANAHRRAR
jgi:hypothetical protein